MTTQYTYRSVLFVPGSQPARFVKAANSDADAVCLDLEDSVAPADKEIARESVVRAIGEIDWQGKHVICRINGMDTRWWYRDAIDLAEKSGKQLMAILLPKANCGGDIHGLDALVLQAGLAGGRRQPLSLEAQIETASGLVRLEEIAAASPRLAALHFGAADYAASMGMRTMDIGCDSGAYSAFPGPDAGQKRERHLNDPWHYPMVRMIAAARANGLFPVDGPYGNFRDTEGLEVYARRAAFLGCAAKWAIHPAQIETINAAFTPGSAEVKQAQRILAVLEEAKAHGHGAASLDGVLLDRVTIRQAERIIALAGDGPASATGENA